MFLIFNNFNFEYALTTIILTSVVNELTNLCAWVYACMHMYICRLNNPACKLPPAKPAKKKSGPLISVLVNDQ